MAETDDRSPAGRDTARRALSDSFDDAREIGIGIDPRTLHVYRLRVRRFDEWCAARDVAAWPTADATLAAYLAELAAAYRFGTLKAVINAVTFANRVTGVAFSPTLSLQVLRGIARVHGAATQTPAPIQGRDLERLAASCPASLRGWRDRALLLVGFCAGLGSAEIVGLDFDVRGSDACGHAKLSPVGIRIEIVKPATLQTDARVAVKHIPRRPGLCPAAALEQWIEAAGIARGPLFRRINPWGHIGADRLQAHSAPVIVRGIVLRAEMAAGASKATAARAARRYAATSLRSGFIEAAFAAGVSEERIATHLGYVSTKALRERRRRHVDLRDHPARAVLGKSD